MEKQPESGWEIRYRRVGTENKLPASITVTTSAGIVHALKLAQMRLADEAGVAGYKIISCTELCPECGIALNEHAQACVSALTPEGYMGGPVCVGPGRDR